MKVHELIEALKDMDPNAEVYMGYERFPPEETEVRSFELYDFGEAKFHAKVRSYGSGSPRWSYQDNVVVLTEAE